MAKTGRPTKLTPQRAQNIIDMVRHGAFYSTAAAANRIHENTIQAWIQRGEREKSGIYYDFVCALREAEALAELDAMEEWKVARKTSPAEIKEFLRRRYPHWNVADKQEQTLTVTQDKNKDVVDERLNRWFKGIKTIDLKRGRVTISQDGSSESVDTDRV